MKNTADYSVKKSLLPDGFFVLFLASEILSHLFFPIARVVFFPYTLSGIVLIVSGILLTIWTNYNLLKKGTAIMPYEMPRHLITSGPYRFSRNPLYLGMAAALFGAAVFLGSLAPFIFPAIFMIVIEKSFISAEEKNLAKEFGSRYGEYKKSVRRWI
jgi:protein-S-isoprenylcysteine O-methyltransferase Ste14